MIRPERNNREGGPERVIDMVEACAPDGLATSKESHRTMSDKLS